MSLSVPFYLIGGIAFCDTPPCTVPLGALFGFAGLLAGAAALLWASVVFGLRRLSADGYRKRFLSCWAMGFLASYLLLRQFYV